MTIWRIILTLVVLVSPLAPDVDTAQAALAFMPTSNNEQFATCFQKFDKGLTPNYWTSITGFSRNCSPIIFVDEAKHASIGLFDRNFIGRNPMTLGEMPRLYIQNPDPMVKDGVDVDMQRDERALTGGQFGFINALQRTSCYGGKNVISFLDCGIDILSNYADAGENVARAAQSTRFGNGATWAMVAEAMDTHNENDPATGLVAEEFDVRAAGTDARHNRIALGIVASPPNGTPREGGNWLPTTIGYGIDLLTLDGSRFDTAIRLDGRYIKGLDCSAASIVTGCILLGDNQSLILSSDKSKQISANSSIIQATGTFGASGGFQSDGQANVGFDCRSGSLASGCLYAADGQPLILSTDGTKQLSGTGVGGFVFKDNGIGSLLTISKTTIASTRPVKLPAYSIAQLPPCDAQLTDAVVIVTDAASPTYRGALKGGGSDRSLAECDGVRWTAH